MHYWRNKSDASRKRDQSGLCNIFISTTIIRGKWWREPHSLLVHSIVTGQYWVYLGGVRSFLLLLCSCLRDKISSWLAQ